MPEIRVRRALASDTPAMLAITRSVWGGTDYLPGVWPQWLNDARGTLMAAVMDDTVVGLQHVAVQPDGSAWLEGIRVAEDVRGTGVGRALLAHGLEFARSIGCPWARLATASLNAASNRLAEGAGMELVAEYRPMQGERSSEAAVEVPVRPADPGLFPAIRAFLHSSGDVELYTEGWEAYRLDDQRLRLLLGTSAVLVAGHDGIDGIGIATSPPHRLSLSIGRLSGSTGAMTAIGGYIRRRAAAAAIDRLRGMVPLGSAAQDALERAGFTAREEMTMRVYALDLRRAAS